MADRYRVGGTASWDGTAGTKRAATSGGAGGEAVPTSSDDVFFNANSGTGTVTYTSTTVGKNVDFTGFGGTLASSGGASIYGSYTLYTGMTVTNNWALSLLGTGTHTIKTAGKNMSGTYISGTGTYTLLDNYSCSGGGLIVTSGTFDTGGFDMNLAWYFIISGAGAKSISLGDSIISLGQTRDYSGSNLTLDEGTSTIICAGGGGGASGFYGNGETYYNVELNGTSQTVSGSNTFADLKIGKDGAQTISFTDGTDQTVSTFTCVGESGKVKTLQGTGAAGWKISCATGIMKCDYMNLSYSTAEGGANFYAGFNSTDGGNNSGWIFYPRMTFSSLTIGFSNYADFTAGTNTIEKYYINGVGGTYPTNLNPVIPASIGGVPVLYLRDNTQFDGYGFQELGLTSVTLPEGLLSIGDYSFFRNKFTGTITIPDSVTNIGLAAFYGIYPTNNQFTSISLGTGLISIGGSAFLSTGLTSLTLPDNLETVASFAFAYCRDLTGALVIPDSVTSIGTAAFYGCKFTSLTLGSGLTEIPDSFIGGPQSVRLSSITIPDNIVTIGDSAFRYQFCPVTLGTGVTTLKTKCFGNSNRSSIDLKNVNYIYTRAFQQCNITSVIIGANVTVEDDSLEDETYGPYGTLGNLGFKTCYDGNSKAAGTYTYSAGARHTP